MSNNELATLNDVKFDCNATLSNDQKKAFVKIIDDEFTRKSNINDCIIKEKKEQLISEYRKQVDFDKLLADIKNAQNAVEAAKNALARVGLGEDGDISSYNRDKMSLNARKGIQRISNLIEAVEREYDVMTIKNKIIARIWLARTYAEAAILLKDTMGNEIIPSIKKKEIEQ